jgi:competence protein CoiA
MDKNGGILVFTAYVDGKDPIHIDQLDLSVNNSVFSCPECGSRLLIKAGSGKVRRHFAHARKTSCNGSEESFEHQYVKEQLVLWLKTHGYQPKKEFTVPGSGGRRADIYVFLNGRKVVFEIQKSYLPAREFNKRQTIYCEAGYDVFWIGVETSEKHIFKKRMSALETIRFRAFPFMHSFCYKIAENALYMEFGHVQFQTGMSLFHFKKITWEKDPCESLYPSQPSPAAAAYKEKVNQEWKSLSRKKRLFPKFGYSRAEKKILSYYYKHQLSLNYYPSLCFLPVYSFFGVQTGAEVWQSWIHWKYVQHKGSRFTLSEVCLSIINEPEFHSFPMTDHPANAVRLALRKYFFIMESLGVLKRIYPGVYLVIQPLTVKKPMEQLLEDDKFIYNKIQSLL